MSEWETDKEDYKKTMTKGYSIYSRHKMNEVILDRSIVTYQDEFKCLLIDRGETKNRGKDSSRTSKAKSFDGEREGN